MKIKNTNKYLDRNFIRKATKFCRPSGISNFDLHVKNSKKDFYGRAYWDGCGYQGNYKPLVVVRIGKNKYPYICNRVKGRGYLSFTAYSREDLFIHILAHELRHIWQAKHKRGWRVWGSRGQFSERDADAYAIHKVREYRRGDTK